MEAIIDYIVWNPSETTVFGLRWYSLCWLVGLLGSYLIAKRIYKDQGVKNDVYEPLFLYCFVGVLIGGRLGHCLFYQPDYFLSSWKHFVEMILPIRFMADGGVRFSGYEGLASHGGVIGLIIAMLLYVRHYKVPVWFVLDVVGLSAPITAFFIRMGNLMNSEIIGKVTDVPWAVIFEQVDTMPRHPGQVYEAIAYLALLFIGLALYKRHKSRLGTGLYFGLCLTYVFVFRFFVEFVKEIQEPFEASLPLDMGQLLSIPFALLGIVCLLKSRGREKPGLDASIKIGADKEKKRKKQ